MEPYGQHSMNSVTSSMSHLAVGGGMGAQSISSQVYYPSVPNPISDDFFPDFNKNSTSNSTSNGPINHNVPSTALNIVPAQPQQQNLDSEVLAHIRNGMTRMMATLERLEQRVNRVEQVTSQILKNQQESFQVPFMSQKEIDNARTLAEQYEQDSSVAKQLQAAYNKEVEVRKHNGHPMMPMMIMSDCPICGTRISQTDLEAHVDQCLDMFSNDPKKQVEVKEAKQKMETGFFSKLFNKKTETTTTTKVISRTSSNAPLPESPTEGSNPGLYPAYGYPQFMPGNMQGMQGMMQPGMQNMQNMQGMPMMMPMYMYPGYGMPSNE